MRTFLWFIIMATGLIFFGCDSSEPPKAQTTAAKQSVKPEEANKGESSETVVPAMAAAQAAADKAEEKAEQTKKMAGENLEKPVELATKNVEETVKATEEPVAKVQEQTASAGTMAGNATEKATTSTQDAIPEEITLEASYGNITFPHGMHAETTQCSTCHGDEDPASFDITKEVAHKLCKGCHKDEGAGPTACKDCHKK